LERFCLELHSNKANKLEVVRRLGDALNGAREAPPSDWTILARELDRVRHELNAYARSIGRVHDNGLSPYEATSQLTKLRHVPRIELAWSDVATVDRDRLAACRNLLREAQGTLTAIGEPHDHPLAGVGISEVASETPARLREGFSRLRREVDGVLRSV